jgi:hypothetical protein
LDFWFENKPSGNPDVDKEVFVVVYLGCQIEKFQTKNPNLVNFWRALQRNMLVSFTAIWYILWLFGIFCGYLEYFVATWNILL